MYGIIVYGVVSLEVRYVGVKYSQQLHTYFQWGESISGSVFGNMVDKKFFLLVFLCCAIHHFYIYHVMCICLGL